MYIGAPGAVNLTKAEQAINTAFRLDPNLPEAWANSGWIAELRGQGDRAERLFRQAIVLNPNYASAYQWLSTHLTFSDRADEALSYAERAVELDPLSSIVNSSLGWCLEALGRFDEAEAVYRKVIDIDPSASHAYGDMIGFSAYARNRFADAVLFQEKADEINRNPDPQFPALTSTWILTRPGRFE